MKSRAERGQVASETVALVPVLAVVIALLWEIVLVGLTFVFAGHAAREGVRELAVGREGKGAALADLPEAWRKDAEVVEGDNYIEVVLEVPVILPQLHSPWRVSMRSATVVEKGAAP